MVIDIRHLTQPEQSGVGEYTRHLLHALFQLERPHHYLLFSSGRPSSQQHVPRFAGPNVSHRHLPIPNRLLNAAMLLTHHPTLDALIFGSTRRRGSDQNRTIFFFPNLNIISSVPSHPYVLTLHDLSFEWFPKFYSRKSRLWHQLVRPRRVAQGAEAIIVPSEATRRDVIGRYDVAPERVYVIPHGVDETFNAHQQPEDHGVRSRYRLPKHFALFVGTLEPRKNIRMIVDAVTAYRKKTGDDLHVVLAGKQTLYVRKIFDALPVEDKQKVCCLGYVPAEHRPSLYRLAEVTLFPSIYEGFGLPILESMASGTPVITSATSSMPEVAADVAILIDPYNRTDLVVALKELLSSPALKERLIKQGLQRAQGFSWKMCAERTLAVLEKQTLRRETERNDRGLFEPG
jgi:glycosyltransferase involved in cell wall biosynthesis